MTRLSMIAMTCWLASCAVDDEPPLPALCLSPIAQYTVHMVWGAGDCVVTDGDLGFYVSEEGGDWVAGSPDWGMLGYAEVVRDGAACTLSLTLAGAHGEMLWLDLNAANQTGSGQFRILAADGGTCLHTFTVDHFDYQR